MTNVTRSSRARSAMVPLLMLLCWLLSSCATAQKGGTMTVRRDRHLDYWDSETLAYHLDNNHHKPGAGGYDVVVFFYVQRSDMSHTLAPYYARIAEILNSGSVSSNLVTALFDCELNLAHSELCKAAHVTKYPTFMFLGAGPLYDTDWITRFLKLGNKDKSAGPAGACPLKNGAKFQGNPIYYESIKDWIQFLQKLSRWHVWMSQGWGRRFRLWNPASSENDIPKDLPVGIPGGVAAAAKTTSATDKGDATSSTSIAAIEAKVKRLENAVEIYANEIKKLERNVARSSLMLDRIFQADNDQDLYATMHAEDIWSKVDSTSDDDGEERVLLSCAMEVAQEYCQRIAKHSASKVVDKAKAEGMLETASLDDLEAQVKKGINDTEPYCLILENCIVTSMADEKCRPATCPFQQESACRYLNTCFEESVKAEYRDALGLKKPTVTSGSGKTEAKAADSSAAEGSSGGGGGKKKVKWGFGI